MANVLTNASAQTALRTLSDTSSKISEAHRRISTGYRINSSQDNAAYWSIATMLRSDVKALGAAKDALGYGSATVDAVYSGLDDAREILSQIKSKLVTASQPGMSRGMIQTEISRLQSYLRNVSDSTVIHNESWLTQDTTAADYTSIKQVVGSFTRVNNTVTVDTINIDIGKTKLYERNPGINPALEDLLDRYTNPIDTTPPYPPVSLPAEPVSSGDWAVAIAASINHFPALLQFSPFPATLDDQWLGDNLDEINWGGYGTNPAGAQTFKNALNSIPKVSTIINNAISSLGPDEQTAINQILSQGSRRANLEQAIVNAAMELPTPMVLTSNAHLASARAFKLAVSAAFSTALSPVGLAQMDGPTAAELSQIRATPNSSWNNAATTISNALRSIVQNSSGVSGSVRRTLYVARELDDAIAALTPPLNDAVNAMLGQTGKANLVQAINTELLTLGTLHNNQANSTGLLANLSATVSANGNAVRNIVAASNNRITQLVVNALDRSTLSYVLSIEAVDANKAEGASGPTPFTFRVIRTGDTSQPGTVDYNLIAGSGTNQADTVDFISPISGTISFAADEIEKLITIDIRGDRIPEPDETFAVMLANPTGGATIDPTKMIADATILNDDTVIPGDTITREEFEQALENDPFNKNLGIIDRIRAVISKPDGSQPQTVSVANLNIAGLTDSDHDRDILSRFITIVDDALQDVVYAATVLGNAMSHINGNKVFVQGLIDANQRGIGRFIDVDVNEETSRLKALQTQEQLAISNVGIANSAMEPVLSLFR